MKIVTGLVLVLVVIWGVWHLLFGGIHLDTGSGKHTGYVTAVERNGVIWKTGRAYVKTSLQTTQEDKYCVTDPQVYADLEAYSHQTTELTLSYHSWLLPAAWECEGEDAIINAVSLAAH